MSDLLAKLNDKQLEAVTLPDENALILAGAGSGKTRVLTTRIAWLIAQGKAYPSEILAVTFTNKAAREMKTRLEVMLCADISRMWVGTFHGLCHRFLRAHAVEAGLAPGFQIIDSSDQLSLVKRILKEAGVHVERDEVRPYQDAINRFKEKGLRAADVATMTRRPGTDDASYGIYRLYEQRCNEEGLVDFAELLLRTVELLERNVLLREHYAARFRYVLVDEFQDTNPLQYRWLKAIVNPQTRVNTAFCVGDDDQSIYAFRGARVGNMADFVREYGVRNIVKLEQNYRSTSHILDAANAVIRANPDRMGKNLWTSSGAGEPIEIYSALDDRDEARTITQTILTETRSGTPFGSFAVLYRNNSQSRLIEQYLMANSIPYHIYGGLRFFERQEVKDLTSYLRMLTAGDDTSFMRIIGVPPRGIGKTSVERMAYLAHQRGRSILAELLDQGESDRETLMVRKRFVPFLELLEKMHAVAHVSSLPETVRQIIDLTGLREHYGKEADKDIRLENLEEVVSAAQGYCEENGIEDGWPAMSIHEPLGMTPLEGFLGQVTLEADDKHETEQRDAVQMMTVHASKGLEFPTVFLCGLEEGLFPHSSATSDDLESAQKALCEERRLMYVAMTRAQKRLRISCCAIRNLWGRSQTNPPSQFLDEIPPEHVSMRRSAALRASGQSTSRGSWGSGSGSYGSGYSNGSESSWSSRSGSWGDSGSRGSQSYGSASSSGSSRGFGAERSPGWRGGSVGRASDFLADKRKKASSSQAYGLSVGDAVEHSRYGAGKILALSKVDNPEMTEARVQFRGAGEKTLVLKFAKLRKLA